ncbi:hypothetical protein [Streptomyces sp. CAI-85]|uniref:hypothetical protein n=1 Tax=Streptomyces sp. CAI-85 TaxID=1472662 RepID=UPI0015876D67|nr:hypothetical protein [Streptomyces sp. CAI-85]NUV64305.1 acylphosphatase [Streptomyces sp. CAI-85]
MSRLSLYLYTRLHPRGRKIREELRAEDEHYDAQLAAALDLAVAEARSATPPGRRPRVDVDDVLDVLARPTFDDIGPSPSVVAGRLRALVGELGENAVDTDAYDAVHNAFRPLLTGPAPLPDGLVEVILTGPEETVQRLTEALVEAAEPSTATPVSYRPAREGTAVRARFRIVPPEDGE